MVAENRKPLVIPGHHVEFVAMQQHVALAVGGGVHVLAAHADVAKGGVDVLAQQLVVVARHQEHLDAVARALEHLLHEGVHRRRPVHAALAHGPEVDDVADQEQVLGVVFLEEIEQPVRLAGARAEVDVGQKDRAYPSHRLRPTNR